MIKIRLHEIIIPEISVDAIIQWLRNYLAENESIKFAEIRPGTFEIEYGTIPLFETLDEYQREVHYKKMVVLMDATCRALEWFPEEIVADEDPPLPPNRHICWFKCIISVSAKSSIHFTRTAGDKQSYFTFFNTVYSQITVANILWSYRRDYVGLMSGVVCEEETPTTRYLLDDLICREICTFLT